MKSPQRIHSNMQELPLLITTGDPSGVGPVVSVEAAIKLCRNEKLWLLGDAEYLEKQIQARSDCDVVIHTLGNPQTQNEPSNILLPELALGTIGLIHVGEWPQEIIELHAPSIEGGSLQRAALDVGIFLCHKGEARGLVTAPVSKAAVQMSGVSFVGQTEYVAQACGIQAENVTMLFLGPRLKTSLVTTHAAIRQVADLIQVEKVERAILHLCEALVRLESASVGKKTLQVAVASLNPHAGESGLFGDEDQRIVQVAIEQASQKVKKDLQYVEIVGLVPAETAYRKAAEGIYDGVVAMYHDQATIASKILDWGTAVNVTWGLPFIRTSVDHGVAYDAALEETADPMGMVFAIEMARSLTG